MTTLNEARERIYQSFVTAWGATSAYTFDNERFQPPAGASWVRVSVRHQVRDQESLGPPGGRKFESAGSVIIQCFVPIDSGMGAAGTLARTAALAFEGRTLTPENIHFTGAAVREIGPDDAWYQVNVEAPFYYHETR